MAKNGNSCAIREQRELPIDGKVMMGVLGLPNDE